MLFPWVKELLHAHNRRSVHCFQKDPHTKGKKPQNENTQDRYSASYNFFQSGEAIESAWKQPKWTRALPSLTRSYNSMHGLLCRFFAPHIHVHIIFQNQNNGTSCDDSFIPQNSLLFFHPQLFATALQQWSKQNKTIFPEVHPKFLDMTRLQPTVVEVFPRV